MTVQHVDVGSARIAYQTFGAGPPLLLIHGWPLSGLTWRHVVPRFAQTFTCIVPDTPGAGETQWDKDHDFRFRGQAEAYVRFIDRLGLDKLSIVAHDTGATIARELALIVGRRIDKLVMINTEIPNHRPPYIRLYQRVTALPGAAASMRLLLRSRRYLHSSAGFGGCFYDASLIDGEFHSNFIRPMIDSPAVLDGQLRYLRGIDWSLVDGLARRHAEIAAETLLIWGEDDPTFPLSVAEPMVHQLARCRGLARIARAKLLVHEERPAEVASAALAFLERQ